MRAKKLTILVATLLAFAAWASPTLASGYVGNWALIPNEDSKRFLTAGPPIVVPEGVVKFTTLVPDAAKGSHGIGIDGGDYKDVKGAWVKPGRMSSLTISLEAGEYELFDSYKNNRALGYRVPLIVEKKAVARVPGRKCGGYVDIWVKRVSCRQAVQISSIVDGRFDESGYLDSTHRVRGFRCTIDLFNVNGTITTCRKGSKQIRIK